MNIIEKLYYGEIAPYEKSRTLSKDSKELSDLIFKLDKKMKESLENSHQTELLEKYIDCIYEKAQLDEEDKFIYGFSLGMKLAMTALCAEN